MRTNQPTIADPTSRFRSDIQGLRAIAVGAVVLYHAGVPFIPGGYVGVDVFFVISGFLITSHLLGGLRRDGRIKFTSFYAKRARRILPAAFVVLGLSTIAALIWYPPLLMREVWQGAVATALYVPNLLFAVDGTNYLAETTPSLFQHYWSLGIEEQFYLVWPLLLGTGFLWFKRPKVLFGVVAAIVLTSFAACVLLTFEAHSWAFFSLPTRAWELGIGGLAAFVLMYRPTILTGVPAALVGWLGVVGILGSAVLFTSKTTFPGYWAAIPVLATAAVIIAGDSSNRYSPQQVLSTPVLTSVGGISYSLYLVHWPLLMIPQAAVGFERPLPLWITLILGAAAFPLAWLMYRYVEEPGRKGAWLANARPRRSLLAAGSTSIVMILIATGAISFSNMRPLHMNVEVAESPLVSPPAATSLVPMNLQPSLRSASDDQPAVYADGCHRDFADTTLAKCVYGNAEAPRIVLFGDSHAAQWFPAVHEFATNHGYSVETHTKSSCPSASLDVTRDNVPYTECTEWRNAVIAHLHEEPPALILISNYSAERSTTETGDYGTIWASALTETIESLPGPVSLIADTPDMGTTPSICLSANLGSVSSCAKPDDTALAAASREAEREVASRMHVPLIDLNNYICSETCSPIIGNMLVYRDAHHLTATFNASLGSALSSALLASGL